jgi:hypothetical protein
MQYVGWFTFGLGLLITLADLHGALRGRPAVTIEPVGVVVMPAFGAPKRVAWGDIER